MSRPVSGKIKTSQVRVKKENGDIYVYERQWRYDPAVRYTRPLGSHLIGVIRAGKEEIGPTRPRRKPRKSVATDTPKVLPAETPVTQDAPTKAPPSEKVVEPSATTESPAAESPSTESPVDVMIEPTKAEEVDWAHVGATDILEWIGKNSGIDEDIRHSTYEGMARKIITVARYCTANPSQNLPRIGKWQRTHPVPCETELSRKNYQVMMEELGEDKQAQMAYFKCRAARAGKSDVLAIDSTTISTYSENLNFARHGYNKDHDGLPTIKLLTAYSLKTNQPIAVIKQPGNIPDVVSIENALKQMSWIETSGFKVVTDNGFYSWENVTRFVRSNIKFLTRINKDTPWVKKEIDAHREEWFDPDAICPTETYTHGIMLTVNRDIEWVRKRSRNGNKKGNVEKKTVRLYLYIFYDRNKVAEEQDLLVKKLRELQHQIEYGVTEFKPGAQKMIDKFIEVSKRSGNIKTSINGAAWNPKSRAAVV